MLRSLVVLSLIGCALGQFFPTFGAPKEAMMKYADQMVMQSCLGQTVMEDMMYEMVDAVSGCAETPQNNTIEVDFSIMPPMVQMMPADLLDEKQDMANAFAANATCILLALEYIKPNGTPNYEACELWINSLNITETLRSDLMEGHYECKDFAECAPVDTIKCPITRRFGRMMAYKKCHNAKLGEACMVENRRNMMAMNSMLSPLAGKIMMDFDDVINYGNVLKVLDM